MLKGIAPRPVVTLFALTSVDGKICTGPSDYFDFDIDLPNVPGVNEGLYQYYDIEKNTDTWALTTGATQAKMYRLKKEDTTHIPATLVVVDTNHLDAASRSWLCARYDRVIFAVPSAAYLRDFSKEAVYYEGNLVTLLEKLYADYDCGAITLGVGGTMAWSLLQSGCIDLIHLVMAPLIVGGRNTPSLVDGAGLTSVADLSKLVTLRLESVKTLSYGYLDLMYSVPPRLRYTNSVNDEVRQDFEPKALCEGPCYKLMFECNGRSTAEYLNGAISRGELSKFTKASILNSTCHDRYVQVYVQTEDDAQLYQDMCKFSSMTDNSVAFVGFEKSKVGPDAVLLAMLQHPFENKALTKRSEEELDRFIQQFIASIHRYTWEPKDINRIVDLSCLGDPKAKIHKMCHRIMVEWCTRVIPSVREVKSMVLASYDCEGAVGNIYVRVMAHLVYLSLLHPDTPDFLGKAMKKVNTALKRLHLE